MFRSRSICSSFVSCYKLDLCYFKTTHICFCVLYVYVRKVYCSFLNFPLLIYWRQMKICYIKSSAGPTVLFIDTAWGTLGLRIYELLLHPIQFLW